MESRFRLKIVTELDLTQRQLVNQLARIIALGDGFETLEGFNFIDSDNPRARRYSQTAERVFEVFFGDRPDYYEDDIFVEF